MPAQQFFHVAVAEAEEVDGLILGWLVGQAKISVKFLRHAQIWDLQGIMQQGTHGHGVFPPGTACNAVKNGACSSLHSLHRQITLAGPIYECCTTIPHTR